MTEVWAYLPGVAVLLLLSGFFSGSEAAFFSLTPAQKRALSKGSQSDRLAFALIGQAERLLMGILFWNLAINISYFSLVSRVSLETRATDWGETGAVLISLVALMLIVVFGEFLPKSLAITYPIQLVRLVVMPLAMSVRLIDVFFPALKLVNEASRRILWPGFKSESYLELADLDRAVELSTDDAQLFDQESQVLRNVIRLSEIRVEEWMRPRTQYRTFMPPVSLEQLGGEKTPSGYMLITDAKGNEVTSVIDLDSLVPNSSQDVNRFRQPLVVIPWCATIADALRQLKKSGRRVAVVVNEYGETIGILTWEEIIEAILQTTESQFDRALSHGEIEAESENSWIASGMTKIRRLERVVGQRLSSAKGVTLAGVIQERLHRMPEEGDRCTLAGLELQVIQARSQGEIMIRVHRRPADSSGDS